MWVWRGGWGCPIDMAESKKTLSGVFQKQKHSKKKNCNQLHAIFLIKSKSSQVNILILDFYLLELSNYKQTKTKQK